MMLNPAQHIAMMDRGRSKKRATQGAVTNPAVRFVKFLITYFPGTILFTFCTTTAQCVESDTWRFPDGGACYLVGAPLCFYRRSSICTDTLNRCSPKYRLTTSAKMSAMLVRATTGIGILSYAI